VSITDNLLSTACLGWGWDLLDPARVVDPVQVPTVAGQGATCGQMRGVPPVTGHEC
jgi:hypothetical protein